MEENSKYIKLTDEYWLGADTYNWTLNTPYEYKGETIYRAVAYCGTIQDIYRCLVEREIKGNISLLENLEKVSKLVNDNFNKLKEITKNIKRSDFLKDNSKK